MNSEMKVGFENDVIDDVILKLWQIMMQTVTVLLKDGRTYSVRIINVYD